MNDFSFAVRKHQGSIGTKQYQLTQGKKLGQYAAELQLPEDFWINGVVFVDDSPIVEGVWWEYEPRAGQSISLFNAYGKGGQAFQLIATIAVVAAMAFTYTIPGIGPFISAAIGIGGSFLISALAPKQKSNSGKAPKQLAEGGFSGNGLNAYEQIATVLGTRRVPAPYLAPPYVEISNNNIYGNGIIGLAGRHTLTDAYADGSLIEVVDDRYAEGDESDQPPSIYDTIVWQDAGQPFIRHSFDIDVSTDTLWDLAHGTSEDFPKFQWFRLGSQALPREVWIDIKFPQGLARIDGSNKCVTAFQLVLKKKNGDLEYLPELLCGANNPVPFRCRIKLRFYEDPATGTSLTTSAFWMRAYEDGNNQTDYGYEADSVYYENGGAPPYAAHCYQTNSTMTAYIYVDPAQLSLETGMSLGIRQGCGVYYNRMNFSTDQYDYNGAGTDLTCAWFDEHSGRTMEDQAKVISDAAIEYVTRFYDDDVPVNNEGFAFYEFQTSNKYINQVTVLAERWVAKKWDAVTGTFVAEPRTSENPGELAYDIMTNGNPVLNSRPLSSSIVDADELGDLVEYCWQYNLTMSSFLAGSQSMEDALLQCFVAAGAYLKRNQKWGCYIEKDRSAETPIQLYNSRNSWNFITEKTFDYKAHALNVTYDNVEDDYQTDPGFIVYAPGYGPFTDSAAGIVAATLFDSVDFRSVVHEWQAEFLAKRMLRIAKYRNRQYSLETDARWLAAERGSLVGVAQYSLDSLHGHGAIVQVHRYLVGGVQKIAAITIDGYVDLTLATTGVIINTYSGALVSGTTTQTGRLKTIVFASALTDDSTIDEGCVVSFGTVSSEYIRCIVDDIVPGKMGSAKLILFDEAPQIFT